MHPLLPSLIGIEFINNMANVLESSHITNVYHAALQGSIGSSATSNQLIKLKNKAPTITMNGPLSYIIKQGQAYTVCPMGADSTTPCDLVRWALFRSEALYACPSGERPMMGGSIG